MAHVIDVGQVDPSVGDAAQVLVPHVGDDRAEVGVQALGQVVQPVVVDIELVGEAQDLLDTCLVQVPVDQGDDGQDLGRRGRRDRLARVAECGSQVLGRSRRQRT